MGESPFVRRLTAAVSLGWASLRRVHVPSLMGYVAFALFALMVSLYLTFPADALAQRLATELQRQTAGSWSLTYADSGLVGGSGLRLSGVVLRRVGAAGEPLLLPFDAVQGRLALLPLLLGRLAVDVQVSVGAGRVSARVANLRAPAPDLRLEVDNVNLAAPPLALALSGVGAGGTLNAEVELHPSEAVRDMAGHARLQLRAGSVGPGQVAGLSLPVVELGDLEVGLEVKEGRAKVALFRQKGGNLAVQLQGHAQLRKPEATSLLDACLTFRADPAFLDNNPRVRAALQIAEVQLRRDGEGFLHAPIVGVLNAPRLRPGLCR